MQNWRTLVRKHLSERMTLCDREEVVSELATHLEEAYDHARASGLTERAALAVTLQEVEDWRVLAADICRAKAEGPMNNRTKSLWLPVMVNLLAASLSLMIMQRMGMQPRLVWVDAGYGKLFLVFYFPWLAALPFFGAAGAYLARRAQGDTLARLAAGLSPALVLIGLICLIAPWGLLIDGFAMFHLVAIAIALLTWGLLPALALLVGALPFLRQQPKEI